MADIVKESSIMCAIFMPCDSVMIHTACCGQAPWVREAATGPCVATVLGRIWLHFPLCHFIDSATGVGQGAQGRDKLIRGSAFDAWVGGRKRDDK